MQPRAGYEDHRGRVTSTLSLSWDPPAYFKDSVARGACHAVVGKHQTTATKDIYLDPASSAALNHLYASAGEELVLLIFQYSRLVVAMLRLAK